MSSNMRDTILITLFLNDNFRFYSTTFIHVTFQLATQTLRMIQNNLYWALKA